ncbi:MAG TPA: hypothetical protein VMR34_05355 [Candidatus Saccharimonadales bacterium]|nr:hypothetical protein [Candidatus Saccharimonadales bacterium]
MENRDTTKQQLISNQHSSVMGRPRRITEGDTYYLIELFKKGYTVTIACRKAGIPSSTYYDEFASNEDFSDKVTAAQEIMTVQATRIIKGALSRGDLKTAMWFLDRQDRRERNAQRAKEYRLVKKLTVTKSYKETQSVELEIDTVTD